jgi:transcriptional regulator with XRE-family HTH domain
MIFLIFFKIMGFRENLKEQLQFSGMYVKELADLSGVKKKTIDGYLNAHEYSPSAENAVKIARVLGVSVEYLVTGRDERPGHGEGPYAESRRIAQAAARLSPRSRRLALALLNTMKKQEEAEAALPDRTPRLC